ncbi:MAG: TatD family hydrolase [Desulfurococcales archaeon]|nr:TatD family hydrolase [Desulfurococcales archaeon]
MLVYDMHSHFYEFPSGDVEAILEGDKSLIIVAVSDDRYSLNETLELYASYPDRIVPCAGFHPWSIRERSIIEAEYIARMAFRLGLRCIGEVGLDKKFLDLDTWRIQLEVFSLFIDVAREIDAFMNIHAPGAWRDVLRLLVERDVRKAMFHWYTGPLDLIDVIGSHGYKVSINPAIRIQAKHKEVARSTGLEYMVFESDGPYNYRGLRLNPLMVRETIKYVADIKGVSTEEVLQHAMANSERLIYG